MRPGYRHDNGGRIVNLPEFIYFDLGNVITFFDHEIGMARLAQQSRRTAADVRDVLFASDLQTRYETGTITSARFCQSIRDGLACDVPDADILESCSAIFELNHALVPLIAQLAAAGHRLGVLSNTCAAHWEWITRDRYRILPHYFPVIVCSYVVGSMKPDRGIYEHAIAAANVPADRIFFVDDRDDNVLGARQAGLDAVLYRGVVPLYRDLIARGVLANF